MSDEEYLEDLEMLGPRSRRRRPARGGGRRMSTSQWNRMHARWWAREQRRRLRSGETVDMGDELVYARPSVDMEPMRVEGRRNDARRQGEEKDRRGRARDLLRSLRRRY